jgi:hypothetical protein
MCIEAFNTTTDRGAILWWGSGFLEAMPNDHKKRLLAGFRRNQREKKVASLDFFLKNLIQTVTKLLLEPFLPNIFLKTAPTSSQSCFTCEIGARALLGALFAM